MSERRATPKSVETAVLTASRRRCCLCVSLDSRNDVRKGQIAHINRDPSDSRFENLVWLCLEHHDEYDSKTSQSKGLTSNEVVAYREKLYAANPEQTEQAIKASKQENHIDLEPLPARSEFDEARKHDRNKIDFISKPWRYPLWQVANQPDLFAYKASNLANGICLIERIDLPDGRIVIACISVAGNPGQSITNAVEELCFQVCERFQISANRLIWLEHYDYTSSDDWRWVTFEVSPPQGLFANPKWTIMTADLWSQLHLKPKKQLTQGYGGYESKLTKLFDWPSSNLVQDESF